MPNKTSNIRSVMGFKDSANFDAFQRFRVSEPYTLFSAKQLYDNLPLLFDDTQFSGAGTTSGHTVDTASTIISVSDSVAGKRVRQSKHRFNYQSGKSHFVFVTFSDADCGTGISKAVGYFDDKNGIFFKNDEGVLKMVVRSFATGTAVDTEIEQNNWNIDRMNGVGESGITLDPSKSQIFVCDFEWLGVGRVRVGFVVDGKIYYCHEFLNANSLDIVYMSTPNLPIRYEIENDGNGNADDLECICASVSSEGGVNPLGYLRYISNGTTHVDCDAASTTYALIGMKLKSGHEGAAIIIESISILSQTSNDFEWTMRLNPTISGAFNYSDEPNSSVQKAIGVTANTVTGGTVIEGGYVSSANKSSGGTTKAIDIDNLLRLGTAIDGTSDEIVLCVTPLSADADIFGSISYRELI